MSTINSIPKVYALGTRYNAAIFDGPIVIEEKIDGSQFSFGNIGGALMCRSKGAVIDPADPGMFGPAVKTAQELFTEGRLTEGYVFQCEFLAKPKHNVLTYGRVPDRNLVLFDVRNAAGEFFSVQAKFDFARNLGLEPVPVLYAGNSVMGIDPKNYLGKPSVLGAVNIEGIVIKNYTQGHPESNLGHSPMTAKVVDDRFKEKMACRPPNPKAGQNEIVQGLVNSLRTEARWLKAIQHLREAGQLVHTNTDIGPLCREIQRDVLEEEADWIKQKLFDAFAKDLTKGVVQGFAQYYQKLVTNGPSVFQQMKIDESPKVIVS